MDPPDGWCIQLSDEIQGSEFLKNKLFSPHIIPKAKGLEESLPSPG